MTAHTISERFAEATDALLGGNQPAKTVGDTWAEDLAVVAGLRSSASAGIADPAFVSGLRAELHARARARTSAGSAAGIEWATVETVIGRLAVAYNGTRVLACNAIESPVDEAAFLRSVAKGHGQSPGYAEECPDRIARAIRDHLAGRRPFTGVDLSALTPFQQRVLAKTAEIPRGEVRPYGWIAREIGSPGATRAVGTALGHNPIPFLIPCHRVVRSDGSLGEYSGGGPAVKERLLKFEGVSVPELVHAAERGERFIGSRTTHIVCYPTCHSVRRIKPENMVPFAALAQAERGGYRPCLQCRPA